MIAVQQQKNVLFRTGGSVQVHQCVLSGVCRVRKHLNTGYLPAVLLGDQALFCAFDLQIRADFVGGCLFRYGKGGHIPPVVVGDIAPGLQRYHAAVPQGHANLD